MSFCFENIALKSFKKLNELQHLGYTSQHVAVVFGLSVSSAVVGVSKDVGLCKSRAFGCGTFWEKCTIIFRSSANVILFWLNWVFDKNFNTSLPNTFPTNFWVNNQKNKMIQNLFQISLVTSPHNSFTREWPDSKFSLQCNAWIQCKCYENKGKDL